MPSRAALAFAAARENACLLIAAAGKPPIGSSPADHKAICLHAALAMLVAAWEAYLERLVQEVQLLISDPAHSRLSAVLTLLNVLTDNEVKKFNTPNAENARSLLARHTGYDPINDWQWTGKGLNGVQTRQRLDEILKVRHSFAHGFAIPTNIAWAKNRNSPGSLNITVLRSVDAFLSHVVKVTDSGMSSHLSTVFGVPTSW